MKESTLVINHSVAPCTVCFLIGDPKQNVNSFMTPFSDSVFYALSHGSLGFAFHGSFFNHSLIGQNSSIANKNLCIVRLIGLPWRTKPRLPCERALKTESEKGAINEFTFCLGSPVKKTHSDVTPVDGGWHYVIASFTFFMHN